jgi:hypothetical protein
MEQVASRAPEHRVDDGVRCGPLLIPAARYMRVLIRFRKASR